MPSFPLSLAKFFPCFKLRASPTSPRRLLSGFVYPQLLPFLFQSWCTEPCFGSYGTRDPLPALLPICCGAHPSYGTLLTLNFFIFIQRGRTRCFLGSLLGLYLSVTRLPSSHFTLFWVQNHFSLQHCQRQYFFPPKLFPIGLGSLTRQQALCGQTFSSLFDSSLLVTAMGLSPSQVLSEFLLTDRKEVWSWMKLWNKIP